MDPAMEGTVLSFECPPQYALSGPNTTICMGNGEWEPDPREAECKGIKLHYTIFLAVLHMQLKDREAWRQGYNNNNYYYYNDNNNYTNGFWRVQLSLCRCRSRED